MKVVDRLPTGPEWHCELVRIRGDLVEGEEPEEENSEAEEVELWLRDPVACVRELIGNLSFHTEIAYAPEKVYTDPQAQTRRYDEMWTGDWWWEAQVCSY